MHNLQVLHKPEHGKNQTNNSGPFTKVSPNTIELQQPIFLHWYNGQVCYYYFEHVNNGILIPVFDSCKLASILQDAYELWSPLLSGTVILMSIVVTTARRNSSGSIKPGFQSIKTVLHELLAVFTN